MRSDSFAELIATETQSYCLSNKEHPNLYPILMPSIELERIPSDWFVDWIIFIDFLKCIEK